MTPSYDAIILGAGANGLVAANVLARAGRRVLVLERAEATAPESRAIDIAPGFRAPISDEAGVLPAWIAADLNLSLPAAEQSDIGAAVVTPDGALALPRQPDRAVAAIRAHSAHDADRWPAFVQGVADLASFLGVMYQAPPPDIAGRSLLDLVSMLKLGRKFRRLGEKQMTELLRVMPMSVADWLDDEFESSLIKAAVGAGGVRDLKQGPRSGGTSFNLLHYLVGAGAGSIRARPYWREGPDALINTLETGARSRGAVLRTSADVRQIAIRNDAVTGVELADGESISAKVVLSTLDPAHTILGLVDPVWLDPELMLAIRNVKLRGCSAFVLFAVDRLPPTKNGVGAEIFSSVVSLTASLDALERSYDATKYGALADQLHIEISAPSVKWSALAPAFKHVVVARIHYVPYALRGEAWDSGTKAKLAERVRRQIDAAFAGFEQSVTAQLALVPTDIEASFGCTEGALTHGELTLDQILFMRPVAGLGRYATPVDGLYLGGAGCHPGPGVTGGAGWLAAKRILSEGA